MKVLGKEMNVAEAGGHDGYGEAAGDCISHFDRKASDWSLLYRRPAFQDRLALFMTSLKKAIPRGGMILDYGCGSGVMSIQLAQSGYDVLGVDVSSGMIMAAENNKACQNSQNVKFELVGKARLEDNHYDGIVCSSVLEYVENDVDLLRQFVRLLKPGGWLFASVPSSASILGKVEDLAAKINFFRSNSRGKDYWHSKRRYDENEFMRTLVELGLEKCDFTYYEAPFFGKAGVLMSRNRYLGMMMLFRSRKCLHGPEGQRAKGRR